MTKEKYLKELSHRLRSLPEAEREDALQYYEEYFEEAPEGEEQIAKTLGNPKKVASSILAEYQITQMDTITSPTRRGFSAVSTVLLLILAAPIGLPLAIAAAATVLALVIVVAAVLFSLLLTGGVCVIAGALTAIISFTTFTTHLNTGLLLLGGGLAIFGGGMLLTMGMLALSKKIISSLVNYVKSKSKKEVTHE